MMNSFDLKCYQKTYQNPHYWEQKTYQNPQQQKEEWQNCRKTTDKFFDELVKRGYLVRK